MSKADPGTQVGARAVGRAPIHRRGRDKASICE